MLLFKISILILIIFFDLNIAKHKIYINISLNLSNTSCWIMVQMSGIYFFVNFISGVAIVK